MVGFFRTLIIIAIIYFALRFIFRIVLPIVLGNYLKKKVSQAQNYHQNEYSRREGEVTINHSSTNDKKHKNNEGEYVDFEEIKE